MLQTKNLHKTKIKLFFSKFYFNFIYTGRPRAQRQAQMVTTLLKL